MEKPSPIKLPHELEKEAEEQRLHAIQQRIAHDRENGTLVSNVIEFLRMFELKIAEFNHYMQLYTPYPTISQTIKDGVRNKLRMLNDFYFSYTGSNPHLLICECLAHDDASALELRNLYNRLGDLLNKLNNNVLSISNKQILFIAKRRTKETYEWNEYDWT
jgi:hypothetical protein